MRSGQPHFCLDGELSECRMRARKLCMAFNRCVSDDEAQRSESLLTLRHRDGMTASFLYCCPVYDADGHNIRSAAAEVRNF